MVRAQPAGSDDSLGMRANKETRKSPLSIGRARLEVVVLNETSRSPNVWSKRAAIATAYLSAWMSRWSLNLLTYACI